MINKWLAENKLLAGFIGLSISSGIASGIIQLVLPLYALSLNVSDAGVGLVRGIGQFGGLLTTLPGGFLIDRFGSRRMYIFSGLLNVLIILIIPTAATLHLLILYLFLEGGVGTIRWTALNTAFFERLNDFGLGKAGWMRASMAIGLSFLGPLLGGQLVQKISFQLDYCIIALFILLPICLMPLLKSNRPIADLRLAKADNDSTFAQFRELFANRLLLRTALIQSLAMSCNNAFSVFLIILLVKNMQQSPKVVATIIATQGIGSVLIMFWGGALLHKMKLSNLYAACYLMQIAGLIAVGFSDNLGVVWAGAVSLGLGTGLITTISYSLLGKMEGKKGKIAGFFYFVTGGGIAFGPILGGFLASLYGTKAAFIGFLPLELCALFYFLCIMTAESFVDSYPVRAIGNKEAL